MSPGLAVKPTMPSPVEARSVEQVAGARAHRRGVKGSTSPDQQRRTRRLRRCPGDWEIATHRTRRRVGVFPVAGHAVMLGPGWRVAGPAWVALPAAVRVAQRCRAEVP